MNAPLGSGHACPACPIGLFCLPHWGLTRAFYYRHCTTLRSSAADAPVYTCVITGYSTEPEKEFFGIFPVADWFSLWDGYLREHCPAITIVESNHCPAPHYWCKPK